MTDKSATVLNRNPVALAEVKATLAARREANA